MQFVFKRLKSMRCFFMAALVVLLVAVGLSHLAMHSLGQQTLYQIVISHRYVWLLVRACIIVGFVLVWPYWVKQWANKYHWDDELTNAMIRRRWRFALWLIIIDLTFQLL